MIFRPVFDKKFNPLNKILIDASRAYEADVTAFNAAKAMASKGLEIGK